MQLYRSGESPHTISNGKGWHYGSDARSAMVEYYRYSGRNADDDRQWHQPSRGGVLVEEADLVLMARPVMFGGAYRDIVDPSFVFEAGDCDAWFIHLMIGRPALVPTYVPGYAKYGIYCHLRGGRGDLRLHKGQVAGMLERLSTINNRKSIYGIR